VIQKIVHLDKREKEVVRLWQSGDISLGSARTYLDWVRRFCAYCRLLGLDEAAELTLEGAKRFALSYVGRRKKGSVCASSCLVAKNALHAWAFALGALGTPLPEWKPKHTEAPLSRLLREFFEFRRCHRGVAEGDPSTRCSSCRGFSVATAEPRKSG